MRTPRGLDRLVTAIENAVSLDRPAELLSNVIGKIERPGPVEDLLSGVQAGHPVHPAVVALPIGSWASALYFDAVGDDRAARRLIGLGLATFVPAAATGASDYQYIQGPERRVGFAHAASNWTAFALFGGSLLARRAGRRGTGVALSAAGAAVLSFAGWLGGHLSYASGVGVDTTAFQRLPQDWTPLAALDDLPMDGAPAAFEVDGVPVLVLRQGATWRTLADRCTHRGAPLHEGKVADGCIMCPWHDSRFDLVDGSVTSGPATRPQTVLENKVEDGRLLVRRVESRTLRTNPTGR